MTSQHSCRRIVLAGHEGDGQVVLAGLGADDPEARSAALGAAHRLQLLDYEILTNALHDGAEPVRRRALQLAARRRADTQGAETDTERIAFVERVVDVLSEAALAEEAAFCLGELGVAGPRVVAALEHQARQHGDALCRESAVAALGALGAGREAVLAATGDVAAVRRRAVIALAAFEGDDIDAALRRALDDRDWQVRQAAEDLLAP